MGIRAVALLKVPSTQLAEALERAADSPEPSHLGDDAPLSVTPLDDGSLVTTAASLDSDPADLAQLLRQKLGRTLDQHADSRGIYVFPDVAKPKARSYDALIDELGELGFWVESAANETAPAFAGAAGPGALGAQLRNVMESIDEDTLKAAERAVTSGDSEAMQAVTEQVQNVLGGGPTSSDGLGALLSSGDDLMALANAASQQIASLSEAERQQIAALARQFGLPIGDPADLMAMLGGLVAPGVRDPGATPDETAPAADAADEAADGDRPEKAPPLPRSTDED